MHSNKKDTINISGAIGYTFLKNEKIKILIFADMHDELSYCKSDDIFIDEYILSKTKDIYKSKVLLEEVPRIKDIKLKELWLSKHTQRLKDVYLSNSQIIKGVDIRLFLIDFSWEMKTKNITLREYLKGINNFYMLKFSFMITELNEIYTGKYLINKVLGKHFLFIKDKIIKFIRENEKYINSNLNDIPSNIMENINEFLSDIMEWYIIAKIEKGINNNITNFIIHAGLFHTTNIIELLTKYYGYEIKRQEGHTDIKKSERQYVNGSSINGCVKLPFDINNEFNNNFTGGCSFGFCSSLY